MRQIVFDQENVIKAIKDYYNTAIWHVIDGDPDKAELEFKFECPCCRVAATDLTVTVQKAEASDD